MADDTPKPLSSDLLRGDMQAMLTYIQGARVVSMAREVAISRLKGWLIGRLWFGLVTAGLVLAFVNWVPWFHGHAPLISALVLIILSSRSGAIVSIGRRMNQDNLGIGSTGDSIYTLASLGSGKNGVALALLSSSVFGLMAFALFASGIPEVLGLKGGLVPIFRDTALSNGRDAAADKARTAALLAEAADRCAAAAAARSTSDDAAGNAVAENLLVDSNAVVADGNATDLGEPGTSTTPTPTPTPTPTAAASPSAGATDTTVAPGCTPAEVAVARRLASIAKDEADDAARQVVKADEAAIRSSGDKWFVSLTVALGLLDVSQLFKMLVWAFIAGFFEQLVPDMLDSLAARGKANREKESNAAK